MTPVRFVIGLPALCAVLFGQAGNLGSVEGQVLNAVTGAPVSGASLSLRPTSGQGGMLGQPPAGRLSTRDQETDDQGRFIFRDLEAGVYQLIGQRQGFVNSTVGFAGLFPPQLVVGEGQSVTGYVVRLAPVGAITGKVTDSAGEPVMNAQVVASHWANSPRGRELVTSAAAQTNESGEFRIVNLGPDRYLVSALVRSPNWVVFGSDGADQPLPDKPETIYAMTYYPSVARYADAAPVKVAMGAEVRDTNIKLIKVNAYVIRGKSIDPGGPANRPPSISLLPRDPALPTTGYLGSITVDGAFVIRDVPPGSYNLVAQRPAIAPSMGPAAIAIQPIDIADKNVDGVTLRLAPRSDVQGTMKAEPGAGCDPRGMRLMLQPVGNISNASVQSASVDDDFKFTLQNILPVEYAISLIRAAARCHVKSVRMAGREVPDSDIPITGSGPLEITLGPATATVEVTVVDRDGKPFPEAWVMMMPGGGARSSATTQGGGVGSSGRVTFNFVRPGPYDLYAWEWKADANPQAPDMLTRFRDRVKPITVQESGRVTVALTVITAAELGEDAGAAVAARRPEGSLEGQAIDALSGAPVAGATILGVGVHVYGPAVEEVKTDAQGRFLVRNLMGGIYRPFAEKDGFLSRTSDPFEAPGRAQYTVGEGQHLAGLILKLMPQAVISGSVRNAAGGVAQGAVVALYRYLAEQGRLALRMAGQATTDSSGAYQVPSLARGDYYIAAVIKWPSPSAEPTGHPGTKKAETAEVTPWYPNGAAPPASALVKVAAGAHAADTNLRLRKMKTVRTDPAGTPGSTLAVTLTPKGTIAPLAFAGQAVAAADGQFEISGVLPGSYVLTAFDAPAPVSPSASSAPREPIAAQPGVDSRMAVQAIEVKHKDTDGLKLELELSRKVEATMISEDGSPVRFCPQISLVTAEGVNYLGRMNCSNGKLTIENVKPVVYIVTAGARNLPAGEYVDSVRYAGKEVPRTGIQFTGAGELEVTLGTAGGIIDGTALDRVGKPAGRAGVVIAPADGSDLVTGYADVRGQFHFGNLKPGAYRVFAWADGVPDNVADSSSLALFAGSAKTVTVAASAHETVQVTAIAP